MTRTGEAELRQASSRALVATSIFFSIFINLLMLSGPLYMLQIYDRVLGSRSEATLVALSLLVMFLFIAMGLLDYARARIMARIGARLSARLDKRVFDAALSRSAKVPDDALAASAQRDLQSMQQFWSTSVGTAVMDFPWSPIFVAAIFVFHPAIGWLAVTGGAVLVALTVIQQAVARAGILKAQADAVEAERIAERLKSDAELLQALGMSGAAFHRWAIARQEALGSGLASADTGGAFQSASRTLRLFLQSAILGLGAWFVLLGELSAGAMIASSILMGRALAPIDQVIGQWQVLTRARDGRRNLVALLTQQPPEPLRTTLPRPRAVLELDAVSVLLPGTDVAALRDITLRLEPGQALGVIGPSGAGKSTLGRVIVGALRPNDGKVRLDGAEIGQYGPETLGKHIGYLPQSVTLFDATVAENIARLATSPDSEAVVAAAQAAAAHQMILRLPQGYDTRLGSGGMKLSGGQIQRLGLARALYGQPKVLVLDEPNSNLDNQGSVALNASIRHIKAAGGSVVIIAHRPAAIQECDMLLMLESGKCRAFGLRDEVLRGMVRNATEIVRAAGPGGVV